PQRPACGGLAAAAQHPVAQSAAAGWPRKPSLRRQKLDTTVERRNHYACTVVSALHRCVGCRCWPSEVAAPLSRRCIVVSATPRGLGSAPWFRQRPVVSALHRGLGHRDRPPVPRNQPRGDQRSQSPATRSPHQWPPTSPPVAPQLPPRAPRSPHPWPPTSPPVAPDLPNSGPQSAQSPQNPTAGSSERSSSKRPDAAERGGDE